MHGLNPAIARVEFLPGGLGRGGLSLHQPVRAGKRGERTACVEGIGALAIGAAEMRLVFGVKAARQPRDRCAVREAVEAISESLVVCPLAIAYRGAVSRK